MPTQGGLVRRGAEEDEIIGPVVAKGRVLDAPTIDAGVAISLRLLQCRPTSLRIQGASASRRGAVRPSGTPCPIWSRNLRPSIDDRCNLVLLGSDKTVRRAGSPLTRGSPDAIPSIARGIAGQDTDYDYEIRQRFAGIRMAAVIRIRQADRHLVRRTAWALRCLCADHVLPVGPAAPRCATRAHDTRAWCDGVGSSRRGRDLRRVRDAVRPADDAGF